MLLRRRMVSFSLLLGGLHDLVEGGEVGPHLVDLLKRARVLVRRLVVQVEHRVRELLRSRPLLLHVLALKRKDICFRFQEVKILIPIAIGPFKGLQRDFFWAGWHLCSRVVLLLEDLVKNSRKLGMGGWEFTVLELMGFFG